MNARRKSTASVIALAIVGASALLLAPLAHADQKAPKLDSCQEKIPEGARRPEVTETFPGQVTTGYLARLDLVFKHGKGETVLPGGFRVNPGSETAKLLEDAGFALADPQGGAPATKETDTDGDSATTKVSIPLIVVPQKSGSRSLTLPQLPITVSRANGDSMTVCSQLHLVTAIDPTAEEKDPAPKPNPPGRPQREDWPVARWVAGGLLIGLLIGALVAWWVRKQLQKPVPEAELVRRLPWEEALEEITRLRATVTLGGEGDRDPSSLAEGKRRAELYDQVSDAVRKYLGARYGFEGLGFDGLETTTGEMMSLLRRVRPQVPELERVRAFLAECDLVKFARVDPTPFAWKDALDHAESIVRATMPSDKPAAPAASDGPTGGPPLTSPNDPPPPGAEARP